ncbi:hypothetical protein CA13_57840 [Planctomycetes bacterium CA13]|uniref:Uncharacterized protein n=1 Tax=Novipirellula herctigrandis TaxID=2527986 RepID=A0A5C5ZAZ6_9BACT|nr:hypothetical protein CA13_57840 [Planctomycetes bacterium CA13]
MNRSLTTLLLMLQVSILAGGALADQVLFPNSEFWSGSIETKYRCSAEGEAPFVDSEKCEIELRFTEEKMIGKNRFLIPAEYYPPPARIGYHRSYFSYAESMPMKVAKLPTLEELKTIKNERDLQAVLTSLPWPARAYASSTAETWTPQRDRSKEGLPFDIEFTWTSSERWFQYAATKEGSIRVIAVYVKFAEPKLFPRDVRSLLVREGWLKLEKSNGVHP